MSFAQQLKSERERLGLTQAGAAAVLEVSKSALEKWEAGIKTPLPLTQEGALARLKRYRPPKANTVQEVNTVAEPLSETNPYGNAYYAEATTLETECARDMHMPSARYWKVINPNVANALGEPPGYKIMLADNAFPFVDPRSSVRRRAGYMDHHLWVTPYDPAENYAVGDYPNQRAPEVADGLPAWTQKQRPIANTDLVCWITLNAEIRHATEER